MVISTLVPGLTVTGLGVVKENGATGSVMELMVSWVLPSFLILNGMSLYGVADAMSTLPKSMAPEKIGLPSSSVITSCGSVENSRSCPVMSELLFSLPSVQTTRNFLK